MKVGNLAVSGEKGVTQQESKAALLENQRRERVIIRTSWVGIVTNVLLALCKAGVGVMSNSIAVLMDAVNNLSDAASSIITIVGTKLAGKEADREHPFGYGRVEYLTAMLISALVLYAGGTALIESVKKIIHPEVSAYNGVGLLLLALSVGAKILLGHYVKQKRGKGKFGFSGGFGRRCYDGFGYFPVHISGGGYIYLVGYQSGGLAGGYHFSVYHQIRGGHAG